MSSTDRVLGKLITSIELLHLHDHYFVQNYLQLSHENIYSLLSMENACACVYSFADLFYRGLCCDFMKTIRRCIVHIFYFLYSYEFSRWRDLGRPSHAFTATCRSTTS